MFLTTHVIHTFASAFELTISNFTLSADNGSGASDGSGDGYIKSTLTETGQTDQEELFFSATLDDIAVISGRSYSLTLELVDNDGNSLTEQVSASTSFSVELPCALELGSINTVCDDSPATTYSGSIAFTGGNTGVDYAITAPSGVTIGGDDPDTVAEGTITFSNMTQGTDVSVNISGDSTSGCDFDRTLYSPACASLPFSDAFDYTVGANLSDDSGWTDINSEPSPLSSSAPKVRNSLFISHLAGEYPVHVTIFVYHGHKYS